jgi:hypothetical protein
MTYRSTTKESELELQPKHFLQFIPSMVIMLMQQFSKGTNVQVAHICEVMGAVEISSSRATTFTPRHAESCEKLAVLERNAPENCLHMLYSPSAVYRPTCTSTVCGTRVLQLFTHSHSHTEVG